LARTASRKLPELEPEERDRESLDRDSERDRDSLDLESEREREELEARLSSSRLRLRDDEEELRWELGRLSMTAPRSVSIFSRSRL
jgi:hypothetical protein